ncbi:MAG: uracil-DNA glycosylase family protein [Luteolibacter sp.]|jgi:single-strand selective monofunctional uracil DNA glycosylase
MPASIADTLVSASRELADALRPLSFAPPVHAVYLPSDYARRPLERYLEQFGNSKKRVVMLGMNPGPWGMAQTGVPFGEIAAVRDWMGIEEPVDRPAGEHPKRPIEGYACTRSEVSGRRLWGLFAERFPNARDFFASHFVLNYCPLVWMRDTGANLTPDKLPAAEMAPVEAACDAHLRIVLAALEPEFLIGVGGFAEDRLRVAAEALGMNAKVSRILHPSPASPAANRGWAEAASRQLAQAGVWKT